VDEGKKARLLHLNSPFHLDRGPDFQRAYSRFSARLRGRNPKNGITLRPGLNLPFVFNDSPSDFQSCGGTITARTLKMGSIPGRGVTLPKERFLKKSLGPCCRN
jgi:hypothetical protein